MTVQSYIESYVPLWMVQQSVHSTKVKLMQLKDFQHIYVLTVIFNCDVNERYIYNWWFLLITIFHINVMQSFIIVLRTLICNSKNTIIKIPLLYNFPLCWLLNVNFKKKNEFGNNCIDVNGFLVKNSFVYIVYTYTFNIMMCDKKKIQSTLVD